MSDLPEVSLHECQGGYAAAGIKRFVISSTLPALGGNFEVQEEGHQHPLFTAAMEYAGIHWDRHCWVGDFSAFRQPGRYRLWAHIGSGHECVGEVVIRAELYDLFAERAAKHFHRKRCGVLCHTHDGYLRSLRAGDFGRRLAPVDVTGGWHDAHDDNKWIFMAWSGVYALCRAWELLRPAWRGANEPLPFPLAEAWWEIEWFLKMQKPDGSFYYGVFDWKTRKDPATGRMTISPWAYNGFHTYDVLADDERWLIDGWKSGYMNRLFGLKSLAPSTPHMYFAQTAAAMAHFARLAGEFDPVAARRAALGAMRTLQWLEKRPPRPFQRLATVAARAHAHLELARPDGRDRHAAKAEALLSEVLALQLPDGRFRAARGLPCLETDPSPSEDRVIIDTPFAYVIPLMTYLELRPRGRLSAAIREAVSRFLASLGRVHAQTGPYGQFPQYAAEGAPASLPEVGCGTNAWFLAVGYLAACGARCLGDPALRALAEKQVQFVLGVNPGAMSYQAGTGRRRICRRPLFVHQDGRDILGGIGNGLFQGPAPEFGAGGSSSDLRIGLSEQGGYDAGSEEVWNNTTAWFLCANAALAAAPAGSSARPKRM